jgi:hypothetical protein
LKFGEIANKRPPKYTFENEISPRKAAGYHVFRIKLTFIAASCGELNPGEIKNLTPTIPHHYIFS